MSATRDEIMESMSLVFRYCLAASRFAESVAPV
jgi:hypothetical protein